MALISCPECGENLSTLAKSCPHCGYPMAEHKSEVKHSLSPQDEKPSGKYTVDTIAYKPDAPKPFDVGDEDKPKSNVVISVNGQDVALSDDGINKVPTVSGTYHMRPIYENGVEIEKEKPQSTKDKNLWFHKFNHYVRMPGTFIYGLCLYILYTQEPTSISTTLIQMYLMICCTLCVARFIGFFKRTAYSYWCEISALIIQIVYNTVLLGFGDAKNATIGIGEAILVMIYYVKRRHYFGEGENG